MKAKVAERGQVTIPKRLRDRLGIRPGTVLEFAEEQGKLVVRTAAGVGVIAGGCLIWVLRGISLLSSAVATMPMWRFFDTLPVLSKWEKSRRGVEAVGKDNEENTDDEEKRLKEIFDFE